jgi:hypothetical protein
MLLYPQAQQSDVAIGILERFAAVYERESGKLSDETGSGNGFMVAVIGSGPMVFLLPVLANYGMTCGIRSLARSGWCPQVRIPVSVCQ